MSVFVTTQECDDSMDVDEPVDVSYIEDDVERAQIIESFKSLRMLARQNNFKK